MYFNLIYLSPINSKIYMSMKTKTVKHSTHSNPSNPECLDMSLNDFGGQPQLTTLGATQAVQLPFAHGEGVIGAASHPGGTAGSWRF